MIIIACFVFYIVNIYLQNVLEVLQLQRVADNLIGSPETTRGLSGGERKRVHIGMELVRQPSVLVLDEPTSGLDSASARNLILLLSGLARRGCTILCSIHQPSSDVFALFDRVLLLSRVGQVAYFGETSNAVSTVRENLTRYEPAADALGDPDILLDAVGHASNEDLELLHSSARLLNPNLGTTRRWDNVSAAIDHNVHLQSDIENKDSMSLSDRFVGNSLFRQDEAEHETIDYEFETQIRVHEISRASLFTEMRVLWGRSIRNTLRNPMLAWLHVLVPLAVGLMIGVVYNGLTFDNEGVQNRAGMLFFTQAFFGFLSMSTLGVWKDERLCFLRERYAGYYRTSSYVLSKLVCDILPLRVYPPLIYTVVCYNLVGLHSDQDKFPEHLLYFFLILMLISVTTACLCFLIAVGTPNIQVGNFVTVVILLFSMIFGGVLLNKKMMSASIRWCEWISVFNYGYEALMVNEFVGLSFKFNPKGYDVPDHTIITGSNWLLQFDLKPNRLHDDMIALVIMSCTCLFLTYLLLHFFIKERR